MDLKFQGRFNAIAALGFLTLIAAWLSGIFALLELISYSEGFTGVFLTGGLAPISIVIIIVAFLGCLCGSVGGVLALERLYFTFVVFSLDLEFASGLLSFLTSQQFFLPLGLPTIMLSLLGLWISFSQRDKFKQIA